MYRPKINIAIDGYSSCGKSTLAKELSRELGYTHIDSGAMYRAITLFLLRNKIDIQNNEAVINSLPAIKVERAIDELSAKPITLLNGENVEAQIRTLIVSENVSEVSMIKEVRVFLVGQQQLLGKQKGLVMEGRDIGTVVFPDAELKLFLTADMDTRAQRRYLELKENGHLNITKEEVIRNIEHRDYLDTHRTESPLYKADDAVMIDNSILSRADQLRIALQLANNVISQLAESK